MKKILLFILFVSVFANAQIVTIPDPVFKTKLLAANTNIAIAKDVNGNNIKIDINNDGDIQQSEVNVVVSLDVEYSFSISDLTGIEAFTNLQSLNCANNSIIALPMNNLLGLTILKCNGNTLTSLDISNNLNLVYLKCSQNNLSNLNVSNNLNLTRLECVGNNLNSLNVSSNINLTELDCSYNSITNLNVSNNLNLVKFGCAYNNLSSLNVTNNINLVNLGCGNNINLTSVNLSNNVNLEYFYCVYTSLYSLNLNNNPNLKSVSVGYNNISSISLNNTYPFLWQFWCVHNNLTNLNFSKMPILNSLDLGYNNLFSLNLKNGTNELVNLEQNPNLHYICSDEGQLLAIQNQLNNLGLTTTVLNTYCSFEPGGNNNTITGVILFDANNNGCDINDSPSPNIQINVTDGTYQNTTFTGNTGNYNYYPLSGSYTLTPNTENPTYFNFSPSTVTIPFANANNNTVSQNFCISANGIHPDLETVIVPITEARPGFDAIYKIIYKNKGNQTISGSILFNFDDSILDYVSSTIIPSTQNTGLLNWNYTNLLPFESRSLTFTLNVNTPTETPPVNNGDILNYSVTVNPITGDEIPSDNISLLNQIVVGSLDPNDKTCLEGNIVSPIKIGDYLHYNINFENTGTAAATFVVVKDVIDSAKFDISSLQIMNSSHAMTTRITGDKVEFIFENINLGAGQHGNVVFKIRTKSTLVTGNTVTNKADIYFDYNFPVITNVASTTFQVLSNQGFELDNSIVVYPNPTNSIVNIKSDFYIKSIQLYDLQGRVLQTSIENNTNAVLDISHKAIGIYFIKITSDKGSRIIKIAKE